MLGGMPKSQEKVIAKTMTKGKSKKSGKRKCE
jgi:hypothetical protein